MLSLCACEGNWESVNLKDPIGIPEDGVIKESVIKQVKSENAIGVFTGKSEDYKYEWTIFGSDITEAKEINLGAQISKTDDGNIKIMLTQADDFGFSALLSVYLDEQWSAQSATAYVGDKVFASVSITGSKNTILNLTLDGSVDNFVICPDTISEGEEEAKAPEETQADQTASTPVGGQDDYLSKPQNSDDKTYTDGKDKYLTDPVPEGKPKPVEPENQEVDTGKTYTCTFSIECSTILNNLSMLDPDKLECVPSNGVILAKTTVDRKSVV